MVYDYKCSCGEEFQIIKSIMEYAGNPEPCPKCALEAKRHYTAGQAGLVRDFEPAYYHSLGKVFSNKRELRYHLDKNNMVEVGNDFGSSEKMQQSFEKAREEKRLNAYKNLLE